MKQIKANLLRFQGQQYYNNFLVASSCSEKEFNS